MTLQALDQRTKNMRAACEAAARAVDTGSLGDFVEQNNKLINEYYKDVLNHVRKDFKIAQLSAYVSFGIFLLTLVYVAGVDLWLTIHPDKLKAILDTNPGALKILDTKYSPIFTVASLGVISGLIVVLFSGVAFYLYQNVARQFSAFHICLERTHRYLVAYKMAEELKENKDETIHDLVCIMANAPMITRADITDENDKKSNSKTAPTSATM